MIQYTLQGTNDKCKVCDKHPTREGYDACIGELPTDIVMNACCGHEDIEYAYIQFWNGERISGNNAKRIQKLIKNK